MTPEEQFDAFWAKYPKRVGKKVAKQKFMLALKRVDFNTMMLALDCYIAEVDKKNEKGKWLDFCNPSTWLHQDRWENYKPTEQVQRQPEDVDEFRRKLIAAKRRDDLPPVPKRSSESKARVAKMMEDFRRGIKIDIKRGCLV